MFGYFPLIAICLLKQPTQVWNEIHRESDEVSTKTCAMMCRAMNQIYLAWDGEYQENLTEFSGQHLWPYILSYIYVYVCTGSTDMYHISPYPVVEWGAVQRVLRCSH